jgi:hypothetical protein
MGREFVANTSVRRVPIKCIAHACCNVHTHCGTRYPCGQLNEFPVAEWSPWVHLADRSSTLQGVMASSQEGKLRAAMERRSPVAFGPP